MSKKVMVSADLMALLADVCNDIMKEDDGQHGLDWMSAVTTSKASDAAGGTIALRTDHDWPVAFMIWYRGQPEYTKRLPRDV